MSLIKSVSASQAKDYYYEKDAFFAPEGKGENSAWYGSVLMAEMGFAEGATIRDADLSSMISGVHPDGTELVQSGVNDEHRGGYDMAFSAPKSVSIAALHLNDERIVEAHKAAVLKALEFVEKNFIQYRETKDGKTYHVKADNMLTAMFTHGTSRANDPQLHTHAIVQNIVQTKDGSFKAISNEALFKHQKLINNIYQNELAINLQEIGYSIDNYTNKFEITGISEKARDTFSKRSKEIDAAYNALKELYPNMSEAELMEKAVRESRDAKDVLTPKEDLKTTWESEVPLDSITPIMAGKRESIERDFVGLAIQELQRTEATFSRMELLNKMIEQSRGEFSLSELTDLLDRAEESNRILY